MGFTCLFLPFKFFFSNYLGLLRSLSSSAEVKMRSWNGVTEELIYHLLSCALNFRIAQEIAFVSNTYKSHQSRNKNADF